MDFFFLFLILSFSSLFSLSASHSGMCFPPFVSFLSCIGLDFILSDSSVSHSLLLDFEGLFFFLFLVFVSPVSECSSSSFTLLPTFSFNFFGFLILSFSWFSSSLNVVILKTSVGDV